MDTYSLSFAQSLLHVIKRFIELIEKGLKPKGHTSHQPRGVAMTLLMRTTISTG